MMFNPLFEQYEKRMMQGNMKTFAKDIEDWALDNLTTLDTFVTEQGDIEDWKSNSAEKRKTLEGIQQYLGFLNEYLK